MVLEAPFSPEDGSHRLRNIRSFASFRRQPSRASLVPAFIVSKPDAPTAQERNTTGFARFSRAVASLNPITVWKTFTTTYEKTKDDLTIKNIEQNRQRLQTPHRTPAASPMIDDKSIFGHHGKPATGLRNARSQASLFSDGRRSDISRSSPNDAVSSTYYDKERLSRQVGDLETKLEYARRELSHAIQSTSPMPQWSSRHEKYTPSTSTAKIRRPQFIPGLLPSLPSERLLLEAMINDTNNEDPPHNGVTLKDSNLQSLTNDTFIEPIMNNSDSEIIPGLDSECRVIKRSHIASRMTKDMSTQASIHKGVTAAIIEHQLSSDGVNNDEIEMTNNDNGTEVNNNSGHEQQQTSLQPTIPETNVTSCFNDEFEKKMRTLESSNRTTDRQRNKLTKQKKRKSAGDDGEENEFRPIGGNSDSDFDDDNRARSKKKRRLTNIAPKKAIVAKKSITNNLRVAPLSIKKKKQTTTPKSKNDNNLQPASPRSRHSGEYQRGRILDVISEDTESSNLTNTSLHSDSVQTSLTSPLSKRKGLHISPQDILKSFSDKSNDLMADGGFTGFGKSSVGNLATPDSMKAIRPVVEHDVQEVSNNKKRRGGNNYDWPEDCF